MLTKWICFIESFQMSTYMMGLLCEGVISMIWVSTIGFVSLRAFK